MVDTSTHTGPYTAAPALLATMNKMRGGTISGPIDHDLLKRIGVKESLVKRTLNSLRTLGLIDDNGAATPEFAALINARPDEYKATLADFLRQAYRPVFEVVDPTTASGEALQNAFWGYEPRGQIDAMIRLFIALCEEAGLIGEERPTVPESRDRSKSVAGGGSANGKTNGGKGGDGGAGDSGRQNDPPMPPPAAEPDPVSEARARYLNMLMDKAAEQPEPDADLYDRIERALGLGDP